MEEGKKEKRGGQIKVMDGRSEEGRGVRWVYDGTKPLCQRYPRLRSRP